MKNLFKSLFWRLALIFLVFHLAISATYIFLTYRTALEYSQEISQKLNRSVAKNVAKFTKPFVNGSLDEESVKELFNDVMVLNPSAEVYLLNNGGKILSYYAPFGKVKLDSLSLAPIQSFIEEEDLFIKGDDPRNPGVHKVFSAARIMNEDTQVGYIYIILASEEYTSVAEMLENQYELKLVSNSIYITIAATLIIGFLVIWMLTRNLNKIRSSVNRFKNGDLRARINLKSKGELSELANNIDMMADTIEKNINEIKSVEKLRKELISNVSHDLRTPLTSVQGYAETLVMMEDSVDKETRLKYLNTILTSTQKVKKLVDDLFEISKLESNQIETKKETFSINEMLSDIVMKYNLIAKSKEIAFDVQIADENTMVHADIALIDRVFQNLLDNAIKHTNPGGKVLIAINSSKDKLVEVIIQDSGVGIPPQELPYIFDRYRKSRENKKEGTGLGLAIVKKILELHKSEIKIESKLNFGTTVTFSLPAI